MYRDLLRPAAYFGPSGDTLYIYSGIPYGLNAIIGLPGETREMVFETIELIRKIEGYDGVGVGIFIRGV